jgi:hypothetical protein
VSGWVERGRGEGRRTDAMKSPKAPPSAKPITPETAVLPGQDSMSICICDVRVSLSSCILLPVRIDPSFLPPRQTHHRSFEGEGDSIDWKGRERTLRTAAIVCASAPSMPPPPGGNSGPFIVVVLWLVKLRSGRDREMFFKSGSSRREAEVFGVRG